MIIEREGYKKDRNSIGYGVLGIETVGRGGLYPIPVLQRSLELIVDKIHKVIAFDLG